MILEPMKNFEMERSSSLDGERQFTFAANAKAFHVLISRLYSNKEGAVVREICTNAYDSLVMAGRPDEKFLIHLPDDLDPNFRVKDNGVGLDEESVYRLMTGVFNSAKEDSNATAGAYGLGSKCPFAITDTFTIISRFGGVKRHFMCFKNEAGVPSVLKTMEEPLEEGEYPTGVEVIVPVAPSKFGRFEEEVCKQLFFFNPRPIAEGYTEAEAEKLFGSEGKKDQLTERLFVMRRHTYPGSPSVIVKVGPVGYPVSWDSFLGKDPEIDRQMQFLRKITSINNHSACYVFDMMIGEVDVPPSRETIEFSEVTIVNMRKATVGLSEGITKTYHDRMREPKTPVEMVKRLNEMEGELGGELSGFLKIKDVFDEIFPKDLVQYLDRDYRGTYKLSMKDRPSWVTSYPLKYGQGADVRQEYLIRLKKELISAGKYPEEELYIKVGAGLRTTLTYRDAPVPEMDDLEKRIDERIATAERELADRRKNAEKHAQWIQELPDQVRFFNYEKQPINGSFSVFQMLTPIRVLEHHKVFRNSEELAMQRRDSSEAKIVFRQDLVANIVSGRRLYIIKDRDDEINLRLMGAFNSLLGAGADGTASSYLSIVLVQPDAIHMANNYQRIEESIAYLRAEFKKLFSQDMHASQFTRLSQFPKGKNPKKADADVNKAFVKGPASGVTCNGYSLKWERLNAGEYKGFVYYNRGDDRANYLERFFPSHHGVRIAMTSIRKGTVEHLRACGLISIDEFIQKAWKNGLNDNDLYMTFQETRVDDKRTISHSDFNGLRNRGVNMGHGILNRFYSNREQWVNNAQVRAAKWGPRVFDSAYDARIYLDCFEPPEGTRLHRQMNSILKGMVVYQEFASSRVMKAYLGARQAVGFESIFDPKLNFNEDFKLFQEHYNKHFPANQTV